MNIIEDIRIKLAKPKLSDILRKFKGDDGNYKMPKDQIARILDKLYGNQKVVNTDDDVRFLELTSKFDRLTKQL